MIARTDSLERYIEGVRKRNRVLAAIHEGRTQKDAVPFARMAEILNEKDFWVLNGAQWTTELVRQHYEDAIQAGHFPGFRFLTAHAKLGVEEAKILLVARMVQCGSPEEVAEELKDASFMTHRGGEVTGEVIQRFWTKFLELELS